MRNWSDKRKMQESTRNNLYKGTKKYQMYGNKTDLMNYEIRKYKEVAYV